MTVHNLLDSVTRQAPAGPTSDTPPAWAKSWRRGATLTDAEAIALMQRMHGIPEFDRAGGSAVLQAAWSAGLITKTVTDGLAQWTRAETDPVKTEQSADLEPTIHVGATRVAKEVQIQTVDGEVVFVMALVDRPEFNGKRSEYTAKTGMQ